MTIPGVASLLTRGYQLAATVEQEAVGRLATVRLTSPNPRIDEVIIDMLFALTGHLLALKVLARDDESRPQDVIDLRTLLAVASMEDREVAGKAAALITQRGFHRNRDLQRDLSALFGE